jgi:hypothetical protein
MAVQRNWLNRPGVTVLSAEKLRAWRATFGKAEGDPNTLITGGPAPQDQSQLAQAIDRAAPRLVTYRQKSGSLALTHTGLRLSSNAAYVFVDPWAREVKVELTGNYRRAFDSFSGLEIPLNSVEGRACVDIEKGPALVRLVLPGS